MAITTLRAEYPDINTYLEKSGDTQANICRVLNIPRQTLSKIVAGSTVPRPELAQRLSAYCKIPLGSFQAVYLRRRRKTA